MEKTVVSHASDREKNVHLEYIKNSYNPIKRKTACSFEKSEVFEQTSTKDYTLVANNTGEETCHDWSEGCNIRVRSK